MSHLTPIVSPLLTPCSVRGQKGGGGSDGANTMANSLAKSTNGATIAENLAPPKAQWSRNFVSPTALPKYVSLETDRRGNARLYYRRDGRRLRLRKQIGTPDFEQEVEAAASTIASHIRAISETVVYFIVFAGNAYVKIGYTSNPQKRLDTIATSAPGSVRLYYVTPGGRDLEAKLHQQFAEDRLNREWFAFSKAIRAWIDADIERRATDGTRRLTQRSIRRKREKWRGNFSPAAKAELWAKFPIKERP